MGLALASLAAALSAGGPGLNDSRSRGLTSVFGLLGLSLIFGLPSLSSSVVGNRGSLFVSGKLSFFYDLGGSSIRGLGLRSGSGSTSGSNVVVEAVEAFGFRAVKVEPPVTDKVVLIEDGSIGAEEGVF